MAIYEDGAYCFGCGWRGDIFDWLQKRDNLDFRGALEVLARRAGVDLQPLTPEQRQAVEVRRAFEDALGLVVKHFQGRLKATPAALDYAHGRAWSDKTIKAERLGYADGGRLPDFGNERAQGIAQRLNTWAGQQGGAVVYVHREGARVVYLAGRAISTKAHYNPYGEHKRPYQNAAYTRAAERLVIVEGQACAVTLGGWQVPGLALAGSGAAGNLPERLAEHAARGAAVYLVPDGDGKTAVDKLAAAVGPELRIIALPDGASDLNAWAQNGGTVEAFEALLSEAKTWLTLRIETAGALQGAARDRELEELLGWVQQAPKIAQGRYKRALGRAFPEIGARDLERLLKDTQQEERRNGNGDRYTIAEGCHCAVRYAGGESYTEPLCNFTAQVIEDVARDNGTGAPVRALTIAGSLGDGSPLPAGAVEVGKFAALNWVNELWGVRAIIRAGRDTKDRLREAIQLHSNQVTTYRHIYTHTGWREIDGRRVYLTGNGAVGGDGVTVELERELGRYRLPTAPATRETLAEAMRASLRFLEIAPLEITAPLWAAAYLAPLAEIVYPGFVLWLYGKTGTLKSTLAALALCHYGEFDDKALFSWGDTGNRLEVNTFLLKDCLAVIDDFAPQSDPFRARQMEGNAAQIVRNVGNQTGRARMTRNLTMAPTYPPRGLVVSTGEQILSTESISARIYTLEMHPGDVDLERLTAAQQEAGHYPQAMAGYLAFLAGQWEDLSDGAPAYLRALSDQARVDLNERHLRLPEALARLFLGFTQGVEFAVSVGALTKAEAESLKARAWEALKKGSEAQAERVEKERPTLKFLEVLLGLLTQGKARLERRDGLPSHIGGGAAGEELLGWYDAEYLYLLGGPTYNRVARYMRDEGAFFPVKEATLRKYLLEERVLLPAEDGHNADVIRIGGETKRALCLSRARVIELVGDLPPEKMG